MLILRKKRLFIIITCLIVSTVTFKIKNKRNIVSKETVALPINNRVIIIDAGHGGEDGGAIANDRNNRGRY